MSSAGTLACSGRFRIGEKGFYLHGETERLTRTRGICAPIEHRRLRRQRRDGGGEVRGEGTKKESRVSFKHITFRSLKSATLSRSCASVRQLAAAAAAAPLLQFSASPFPSFSQCHPCVGGEAAAILDSIKTEMGKINLKKKKRKKCLGSPATFEKRMFSAGSVAQIHFSFV